MNSRVIPFFAEFWKVDPTLITEAMALDDARLPNNSSIRFYLFMAAVEKKFLVQLEDVHTITTFGELSRRLEMSLEKSADQERGRG